MSSSNIYNDRHATTSAASACPSSFLAVLLMFSLSPGTTLLSRVSIPFTSLFSISISLIINRCLLFKFCGVLLIIQLKLPSAFFFFKLSSILSPLAPALSLWLCLKNTWCLQIILTKHFLHFHQIGRNASISKIHYKVLPTFTFLTQRKFSWKPKCEDLKTFRNILPGEKSKCNKQEQIHVFLYSLTSVW